VKVNTGQCSKFGSEIGQKSKFWPKSNVSTQIKILENIYICKFRLKIKFWSKIKKMVKNQKFGKTYEIDLFIQQGQL
jgi:hypothetical protein